jgi:FMN phosphatase YigB (HAD superfamily)
MTDKYFVSDIGDVLCYVKLDEFIDLLEKNRDVNGMEFLNSNNVQQDLGYVTMEYLCKKFDKVLRDKLINTWNNVLEIEPMMLDFLKRLDSYGFRIALLSNMGREHIPIVRKLFEAIQPIYHFSSDVGARKPSKLFYQSFLYDHPQFRGCYFIDDRLDNLKSATGYFKTIRFCLSEIKSKDELYEEIRAIEELVRG